MRTLATLILAVLLSIPANAALNFPGDYIATRDGNMYFASFSFGLKNIRARHSDGRLFKVTYNDVVSYKKDNIVYERKSLYRNHACTGKSVFMELVAIKHDLKLYRYQEPGTYFLPEKSTFSKGITHYYVYRGDEYLLELTPKNAPTVCGFFLKK